MSEAPRALVPPLIAAVIAVWIVSWQGVPYLVLLVALCTFAAEFLMRRTRYGAQLYAIGGNPEAARLSGINHSRAIFWNFVIAGLAYGITGVALTCTRERRRRRGPPAFSLSSTRSPRRLLAALRFRAAGAGFSALSSARC